MELEAKCEYLERVEQLYRRALESVAADLKDGKVSWHSENETFAPGLIEKRFMELVVADIKQQIETLDKKHQKEIQELKFRVNVAMGDPQIVTRGQKEKVSSPLIQKLLPERAIFDEPAK